MRGCNIYGAASTGIWAPAAPQRALTHTHTNSTSHARTQRTTIHSYNSPHSPIVEYTVKYQWNTDQNRVWCVRRNIFTFICCFFFLCVFGSRSPVVSIIHTFVAIIQLYNTNTNWCVVCWEWKYGFSWQMQRMDQFFLNECVFHIWSYAYVRYVVGILPYIEWTEYGQINIRLINNYNYIRSMIFFFVFHRHICMRPE